MPGIPDPPAPRAVPHAQLASLAAEDEPLARRWLAELVRALPLSSAAELPWGELAAAAPGVCSAAMEAVGSDAALARLRPGGELAEAAGRLLLAAGGGGPAGAGAVAECLRATLWAALEPWASREDSRLTGELADRLAHVCVQLALAAGAVAALPEAREPEVEPESAEGPERHRESRAAEPTPAPGRIQVLDTRPAAAGFMAAIERRLERHADDGRPFAVLVIEIEDIERLVAAAGEDGALEHALREAERAVDALLRPGDALTCESTGRYWLIAPDTDFPTAAVLAERLAAAVHARATHRGAPLRAVVGVAVCPQDGTSATELAAYADLTAYSARAAGRPTAPPR